MADLQLELQAAIAYHNALEHPSADPNTVTLLHPTTHPNAIPSTPPHHNLTPTTTTTHVPTLEHGGVVSQRLPTQLKRSSSPTQTQPQHRVFAIYHPFIQFTSDSGATDIILRKSDSHVLTDYTLYDDPACSPRFDVADGHSIYPLGTGYLRLIAYVFSDHDLADNLFGLAPIINLGHTATYSSSGLTIRDPRHHVVIYGTKFDNVWKFSLPKPPTRSANIIVRHEQSTELVLYASASFGSPTYATF